jgi:hypothetical protein
LNVGSKKHHSSGVLKIALVPGYDIFNNGSVTKNNYV